MSADHSNIFKNFAAFLGEAETTVANLIKKDAPTVQTLITLAETLYTEIKAAEPTAEAVLKDLAVIIADLHTLA